MSKINSFNLSSQAIGVIQGIPNGSRSDFVNRAILRESKRETQSQLFFSETTSHDPQRAIRTHFLNGGTLTVKEAQRFGTTELRRIVSRLKNQGHNFGFTWDTENGSRFKRYFLINR